MKYVMKPTHRRRCSLETEKVQSEIMEELTAQFSGAFQVTHAPNTTDAPHPRFQDYYKAKTSVDQTERRRRVLERQKETDYLAQLRNLSDFGGGTAQDAMDTAAAEESGVKLTEVPGNVFGSKKSKKPSRMKDQLMFSEWLLEVPENFENDWIMVPCPYGRRNLVVACNGVTKAYTKSGYAMFKFPSLLPGGSRSLGRWREEMTVLDCVFNEHHKTFFVLDIMCWKCQPLYDTETEFRFFWLQTKFQEIPAISEICGRNRYRFEPVPHYTTTKSSIEEVMSSISINTVLDGILFYHKSAYYTLGTTPTVLWLKAYMMPEILGVAVPDILMGQKPLSYKDFSGHVAEVQENKIQKQLEEIRKTAAEDKAAADAAAAAGLEPSIAVDSSDRQPENAVEIMTKQDSKRNREKGSVIAPGKFRLSPEAAKQVQPPSPEEPMATNSASHKKRNRRKKKAQANAMETTPSNGACAMDTNRRSGGHGMRSEHFGKHQFGTVNTVTKAAPPASMPNTMTCQVSHKETNPAGPSQTWASIGHVFRQMGHKKTDETSNTEMNHVFGEVEKEAEMVVSHTTD